MFEEKDRQPMSEQKAFARLTSLCARSEQSSGQMLDKMRQWGIEEEAQARIMARLTEGKFVDDERFCRLFVDDKIRFSKWGRRKIEVALMQKGIDRAIFSAVLNAVDDDEYISVLRPMLRQKSRTIKAKSDYEHRQKLMKYAVSRGYTFDIIKRCMDVDDEEMPECLDD